MKFQRASLKEIKRIGVGCGLCLVLMIAGFSLFSIFGIGKFDYRVLLGGSVGTLVAIGNFAALCLTIQNAASIDNKKQMKSRFQLSYNIRLIVQAAWVVLAFLLPCFHGIAAALPLLFPTVVIFFLQSRGILVTPSRRKNPPQEELQEERPDPFEA